MKLTLAFLTNHFPTWTKSQDKNVNILRTRRAFNMKQKVFFIILKGLSELRNCFRFESGPLSTTFFVYFSFISYSLRNIFPSVFYRTAAPKDFTSYKKTLVMDFFFNKVVDWNITQKGLYQRFFLAKIVKFFKTALL